MAKKDYDIKYKKLNCKQYNLLLHKENDRDIIAYLDSLENRNGTLKSLIREQIKKGGE